MNGIERISGRLVADAKAEIAALEEETKKKCDAILAEYTEKASQEYEERISEGQKACASRLQRLSSSSEMEAKNAILAFKQEMVAKVFEDAQERLIHLPKEEYVAFLARLAANAATYGTEELVFNERDAAAVGKDTVKAANALLKEQGKQGGLTLSEDTKEIPGGVIVRMGNIDVNCAVDTLLQMRRSELASQVAEILFS